MDYYEALRKQAVPVDIEPKETSYFSTPSVGLDPRLFIKGQLNSDVRNAILAKLFNYLKIEYYNPEAWTQAWLAGSGVSHQWAAQRDPADLDCLVGINYIQFRQSNHHLSGLSDREIASLVNEGFKKDLNGDEPFMGVYELTFYANVKNNIEELKPYAAYSLTNDSWVVPPQMFEADRNPEYERIAEQDLADTEDLIRKYSGTLESLKSAPNDAVRRNLESVLVNLVARGAAMFDDIHGRRSEAFSEAGEGYSDFNNYRWQAGKRSGVIAALKLMHTMHKNSQRFLNEETYGIELPTADVLIRRAISNRFSF